MRIVGEETTGRAEARSKYLASNVVCNVPDGEWTGVTRIAYEVLVGYLRRDGLRAYAVEFVRLASGEWVILEVRGQSSVTGHGRQGVTTDRLAFLRELGERYPVLFVFVEGYQSYEWGWLHDLRDGLAVAPSRAGFRVRDMTVVRGEDFVLPDRVTFVDHDQAVLPV